MQVTPDNFELVLGHLRNQPRMSLDCETTSLRPYHGGRPFAVILASPGLNYPDQVFPFYFSFHPEHAHCLGDEHWAALRELFSDPTKIWDVHNAKFDLAMLAQMGIEIAGTIHCTRAIARVHYNDHMSYSLDACGERIGEKKSDAVEKYIEEHGLWEWQSIPGKKTRVKNKFYSKVPLDVMQPYAEQDVLVGWKLAQHQEKEIRAVDDSLPPGVPPMSQVVENERRLTKTVFNMERQGLLIDIAYTKEAEAYEAARALESTVEFERLTGLPFKASPKLFGEIFQGEKEKWEFTEKGNPSFESTVLEKFDHPAARQILIYRDAKSKADFYAGFLYHADSKGYVHPNLNPDGTVHGRFSSSEPNFQNLTGEKPFTCTGCKRDVEYAGACPKCGSTTEQKHYLIRKAIIPPKGFLFIMPDFRAMEFVLMLQYAAEHVGYATPLVKLVQEGMDVHEATAQIASRAGVTITRDAAKMSNFLSIYGGGDRKLSEALQVPLSVAREIRSAIFRGAPEIKQVTDSMEHNARLRGYVRNWLGRRCYFPNSRFTYRAPNYIIAGGCADIVKVSLNRIDDLLKDRKSKLVLSVHDENIVQVHESEISDVPRQVLEVMEGVYKNQYLPLQCSMEYSYKNLAEKVKGFPA